MKLAIAVAAVLACTSGAMAEKCRVVDAPPPEARRPATVFVALYYVDSDALIEACGFPPGFHTVAGCTFSDPTPAHPDRHVVLIDNGLTAKDTACVLIYENAHLPPNNWLDWRVEFGYHSAH